MKGWTNSKLKFPEQDHTIYELCTEINNLKKDLNIKDIELDEVKCEIDNIKSGLQKVGVKQIEYEKENVSRFDKLDQYGHRNMLRLSGLSHA